MNKYKENIKINDKVMVSFQDKKTISKAIIKEVLPGGEYEIEIQDKDIRKYIITQNNKVKIKKNQIYYKFQTNKDYEQTNVKEIILKEYLSKLTDLNISDMKIVKLKIPNKVNVDRETFNILDEIKHSYAIKVNEKNKLYGMSIVINENEEGDNLEIIRTKLDIENKKYNLEIETEERFKLTEKEEIKRYILKINELNDKKIENSKKESIKLKSLENVLKKEILDKINIKYIDNLYNNDIDCIIDFKEKKYQIKISRKDKWSRYSIGLKTKQLSNFDRNNKIYRNVIGLDKIILEEINYEKITKIIKKLINNDFNIFNIDYLKKDLQIKRRREGSEEEINKILDDKEHILYVDEYENIDKKNTKGILVYKIENNTPNNLKEIYRNKKYVLVKTKYNEKKKKYEIIKEEKPKISYNYEEINKEILKLKKTEKKKIRYKRN